MGKRIYDLEELEQLNDNDYLLVDREGNQKAQKLKVSTILEKSGGVGQVTPDKGEIFNDYKNNKASLMSHAEGSGCKAEGISSHAEGSRTTASGSNTHAEGNSTTASGARSHAEGANTTASGSDSHAEGNSTTASGSRSHAEGYRTIASGNGSHAEGFSTKTGRYDNDGNYIEETGYFAHAEGNDTIASGDCAHAEGHATRTEGYASHAEGESTVAIGRGQHVEGRFNQIDEIDTNTGTSKFAHIVGGGNSEEDRKNLHTLDWSGNAWFAGSIKIGGDNQDDSNAKLIATQEYVDLNKVGKITDQNGEVFNDYENNKALSNYSSAKGKNTIAGCRGYWYSSVGSITEGDVVYSTITLTNVHNAEMTEVWTESDVCEYQTGDIVSIIADNKYYNCATIRSINNNIITLNENLDEVLDSPKYTYDDGFDGNIIYVISKPDIGIADIGIASSVEGGSHKNSEVTGAVGPFTHVEGRNNKAIGHYSHAEGRGNNALNIAAHVEGQNSVAEGVVSHAEGANCSATGSYSHAEGNDTKAKGHISHAEGAGTETGENTVAAHVQGYRTKATANFQDVSGKYNKIDDNKAVIVGNGNSYTDRSNAYELDWEGNAWYAGTVEMSAIILRSSTPGSTVKFKLTIDDEGTLSAVKI